MSSSPLQVPLRELPADGLELSIDQSLSAFRSVLEEVAEQSSEDLTGSAELHVQAWPGRVDIRGEVGAQLKLVCVRCLASYGASTQRKFTQILLLPDAAASEEDSAEEQELTRGDLDREHLVGDTIDLATTLREEILLSLPVKPLCKEGCKGICAGCGAELNEQECTCKPEVDPRWKILEGLKLPE